MAPGENHSKTKFGYLNLEIVCVPGGHRRADRHSNFETIFQRIDWP